MRGWLVLVYIAVSAAAVLVLGEAAIKLNKENAELSQAVINQANYIKLQDEAITKLLRRPMSCNRFGA